MALRQRPEHLATLAGLAAVFAVRLFTLPRSLWELDEFLFVQGVERFEPLRHHPHPPGYPLLIGLGKALCAIVGSPFLALVVLSVASSLVSFVALAAAFRRVGQGHGLGSGEAEYLGVSGALLVHLSPAMLVHGPLPMSDPPALAFLSLSLLAATRTAQEGRRCDALALGACLSAAIGCRPQLALAVLPTLAVGCWLAPSWRRRIEVFIGFAAFSLVWFVPLLVAVGGPRALAAWELRQTTEVVAHDASLSRAGRDLVQVVVRYGAHPWGRRSTSIPLLALAGAGALAGARRRARLALPAVVLTVSHLAFCVLLMDPSDGVRYALPALPGVALAAAAGCLAVARRARVVHLAWLPPAVLLSLGAAYTWPVLVARATSPSPPVQAARFVRASEPNDTALLVDRSLAPHAELLLSDYARFTPEEGLDTLAGRSGTRAVMVANGGSTDPDARVFAWPASDAYSKLTRDQYRVVSVIPVPPESRYRTLHGIHDIERTADGRCWRWLDREAALVVAPRGAPALRLELGLLAEAPFADNGVTVSVAGGDTVRTEVPRGGRRVLSVPLPPVREVALELRAARAFVPADEGLGRDRRRLAVQLLGLEMVGVAPVSSPP